MYMYYEVLCAAKLATLYEEQSVGYSALSTNVTILGLYNAHWS